MKKNILLFLSIVLLSSCNEIIDNIHENSSQQNYVSPYKGNYKGNFVGDHSGELYIQVSEKGFAKISIKSLIYNESYDTGIIGSSFNTTNKSPSGFMLIGNLNSSSGTWEMGKFKGSWSVKKD